MSTEPNKQNAVTVSAAQRRRLFIASCIALVATAMTFAIRGDIMPALRDQFGLTNEELGTAAGAWAYGFTVSIFIGGQLVDFLGMGRVLTLAFIAHLTGILLTIFTAGIAGVLTISPFWILFAATLGVGLGNGLVEAAVNPLTATIYPDQKTEKLNLLHVWFPGGIVIGGLASYALSGANAGWKVKMAIILIPLAAYGFMFLGQKFPPTERVQQGVSTSSMYKETLRPLFLVMLFCMILTASTELAPNQWIPAILTTTAGMSGILILVWINGLMAVGRAFAGPMVHRLSPIGLLIGSSTFSVLGLYLLSMANSQAMAFAAATIFAIGICYFWPTMLGVAAERFPAGGALVLAIIGGTGTLSVAIFTWIMGGFLDRFTAAAVPAGKTIAQLQTAAPGSADASLWTQVQAQGGAMALRYMAILPALLILIFTAIWLYDRARGGYKVVKLAAEESTK
ncbi:MAG: MFS transporter [Acidobacteria bacterium]|nr:MFS transporter [Acidobacteriota bacterium]